MKQAFKIILTTLLVWPAIMLSSCVKEDLSNCPPPSEVKTLKLTFVPRQTDITPSQADLKMAVVYVFDRTGGVFTTWTKSDPALNTSYDTGIILGEDTYRLVAWINPEAPYTVSPAYTPTPASRAALDEGRLTLNIPQSGSVTDEIPMLLYGSTEQVIAPVQDVNLEIPLTLDTYRVNVKLAGLTQDGSTYMIKITDSNGSYDFNNNFVATPEFNYERTATVGGTPGGTATGDLTLSLTTLRLNNSRSPMISIVNTTTGKTVFPSNGASSINLMDLIRQTGIDIEKTHLLNIEITPPSDNSANSSTTIMINGWKVVFDAYNIINS